MSPILITSDADKVAAQLRSWGIAKAMVSWSDMTAPTIVTVLRMFSPVGKRDDPRTAGRPHMRDRIRATRQSDVGGVTTTFQTNVGLYPYYVIGGVAGGRRIMPKGDKPLAWLDDGGEWRYAMAVTQGAIAANPFNRIAWDSVAGGVLEELVLQLRVALA